MRFTQDTNSGINLIRSYGARELRVKDKIYRGTVIVSASNLIEKPEVLTIEQLFLIDTSIVLTLDPELVLLGTGARQHFPPAAFGARFLKDDIGFEVMNTGAACRTFNVLVGEQRRVAAILMA